MMKRTWLARYLIAVGMLVWGSILTTARPVAAEEEPARDCSASESLTHMLDNDYYKVTVDVRARMELADFEGSESSQAYTIRTQAGIGTKPIRGISVHAALENIWALASDEYFDTVEAPTGQSPIADPEETDLFLLYARYQNTDLYGLDATVGRQRITLDDHRFVGNVGWRQDEQVFDAVRGSTSLGIDHLEVMYAYIDAVRRIFGNDGPPATRDFRSDSHLIRVGYDAWPQATLAAFAYLLDFDNSPANSSNSYGLRFAGNRGFGAQWVIDYFASYALQTDAGDNPVDYVAHYVAAEGGSAYRGLGRVGVGYELLGSDGGKARFVTPLATGHKFNGWADVFLDNGGPMGLQDLYASIGPQLPFALKGSLIFHQFWSHDGGDALGREIDAVLLRAIGPNVTVLTKGAYFDGTVNRLADRWRYWLEVTFHY